MQLARVLRRPFVVALCGAIPMSAVTTAAGGQPGSELSPASRETAFDTALQLQDAFASVAERVLPSVVCITSYVREPSAETAAEPAEEHPQAWQAAKGEDPYPGFRELHSGSGVVIGEDAHVVTLRQWVIQDSGEAADLVDVETREGRHLISHVLGVEPTLNVAVLQLVALSERYPPHLVPAIVGDSDSTRVGHWTFALGDPPGPIKVFAPGVMAALPERRCYQAECAVTYLQASLRVHPGAYGGPLVNIHGEVIGILTPHTLQETGPDGFEYALPMNVVLPIYNGIRVNQGLQSPWLGFSVLEIADLHERLPESTYRALTRPRFGVYIDNVFVPSPASKAGIRVGDFLLRFNGRRLYSVYQFQEQLHLTGIGRAGTLEIFRNGHTQVEEVMVEERPSAAAPRY